MHTLQSWVVFCPQKVKKQTPSKVSQKSEKLKSIFFLLPELPKQKNSCSKIWLIHQLYTELGFHVKFEFSVWPANSDFQWNKLHNCSSSSKEKKSKWDLETIPTYLAGCKEEQRVHTGSSLVLHTTTDYTTLDLCKKKLEYYLKSSLLTQISLQI